MRTLKRLLKAPFRFVERCSDALWFRRNAPKCGWGEAWIRAGWWQ